MALDRFTATSPELEKDGIRAEEPAIENEGFPFEEEPVAVKLETESVLEVDKL